MRKNNKNSVRVPFYKAIVVGVSAGGFEALNTILPALPADLRLALLIVQHRPADADSYMTESLNKKCAITVKEADEKELIRPGVAYIAPANYHMLVELERTISLSTSPSVGYSRPSINVLFETAADAYGAELVGMVLTGANSDGAHGLKVIVEHGGLAVVEDPESAVEKNMPLAALKCVKRGHVLRLEQIAPFISKLALEAEQRKNFNTGKT